MTTQQQNEAIDFVHLLDFNDYEILNVYPFTIRRKDTHRIVKESIKTNGYKQVALNGKHYLLHRIIPLQFIHNDYLINKYIVNP